MKTFIVLGMHRSATSLVAKALSNEISMGSEFLPAATDNPTGFYEDIDFFNLNNRILRRAGGSWREPPSEKAILATRTYFDTIIQATLESKYKSGDFWGWKDPRTTLTIRLYLPYLKNPHFISCFRDPKEVANSLMRRDSNFFTRKKALALTSEYNQRLLKFLADFTKI